MNEKKKKDGNANPPPNNNDDDDDDNDDAPPPPPAGGRQTGKGKRPIESPLTMKISKPDVKPKQEEAFLDDHVGLSLAESIARLINRQEVEPETMTKKQVNQKTTSR
jgi:hypothetical protein